MFYKHSYWLFILILTIDIFTIFLLYKLRFDSLILNEDDDDDDDDVTAILPIIDDLCKSVVSARVLDLDVWYNVVIQGGRYDYHSLPPRYDQLQDVLTTGLLHSLSVLTAIIQVNLG